MIPHIRVEIVHPGSELQCRSYLVIGPQGTLLVDPGSGIAGAEIFCRIRALGLEPSDLSHVLLTHCHVDHALGAGCFRALGAELVSSPPAAEALRTGSHRIWYEHPERVKPVPVDITAADGENLLLSGIPVRVLHTPGHTVGCATFLIPRGKETLAFTGDLLMPDGQPGWAGSDGFSRSALIHSIEKVLRNEPDRAFPGHGGVEGDPRRWLRRGLRLAREGRWKLDFGAGENEMPQPMPS